MLLSNMILHFVFPRGSIVAELIAAGLLRTVNALLMPDQVRHAFERGVATDKYAVPTGNRRWVSFSSAMSESGNRTAWMVVVDVDTGVHGLGW